MKNQIRLLLLCFFVLPSCSKEQKINNMQDMIVGTYETYCYANNWGPPYPENDSTYYDTIFTNEVLEVSKFGNYDTILLNGAAYVLSSGSNGTQYTRNSGRYVAHLTFITPDSIRFYYPTGGIGFGNNKYCYGRKR